MEEKKTYVCLKCGQVYKPEDKDYKLLEASRWLTRTRMINEMDIDPDEINADITTCPDDGFIMIPKDYFNSDKDFIEISKLAKEIYKTFGHRAFMNIGDEYTYVKIGCDSKIFDLFLNWITESSDKFGIQSGFSNRFIDGEVCYNIEFYKSNRDFYKIARYLANKVRMYRMIGNFSIKYVHPITVKETTNEV